MRLNDIRSKFFSKAGGDGNKGNKWSLKWRVTVYFLAFALIMLILLWLFETVFLQSFYKAIKTSNLTSCAQSIEQNINNEDLKSFVEKAGEKNDSCIVIYTPLSNGDYSRVCSVEVNYVCSIHNIPRGELDKYYEEAKANDGRLVRLVDSYSDGSISSDNSNMGDDSSKNSNGSSSAYKKSQSLVYISIVEGQNGKEYMIMLSSVVTPIDSTVKTLHYQLYIITILFLFLSVVLSIMASQIIAAPIININKSAKELAEGNYDVNFNGLGYKEIEELNETLNYAASELSQVDQMRKDLIANVSHDLRTPLTLITGYGEVMRDIPGENTAENIQIIIDEATRLSSLVNDLIDISKIEAGTMKLEASTFCITDSIKEMFGRYSKLKEQDGFTFDFEHDCDVYVYADQLKISQVIYNLVNNAVNYTGDNKNIIVRQKCYDNRVRIEVEDHGPGIPPDKLKSIWDRYYKVDKSHKSAKIGTGLGLSIVKSVLKLHRAQFGVLSTLGKGSTFWFELYRTNEDGEPL